MNRHVPSRRRLPVDRDDLYHVHLQPGFVRPSSTKLHRKGIAMRRRTFALASCAWVCTARAGAQPVQAAEGTHYAVLSQPQAPSALGKIDVLEFFSYACPACRAFDPALDRWSRALPADVAFRRVPVPFLYNAENFQRTFFALEAMGMAAQIHGKVFDAVHAEKRRLAKPEEIADVVARNGGDAAGFLAAFNAFSMRLCLARAKAATSNYRIAQIPVLAIGGRFVTSPSHAGGTQQALLVADQLIQRARKA
jgi:protein dithiol oxidoreductase (disulfide-forming)